MHIINCHYFKIHFLLFLIEVIFISYNEFIKFLTNEVTAYLNLSKEDRKERRQSKKSNRTPYAEQMLGIIPFICKVQLNQKRKRPYRLRT